MARPNASCFVSCLPGPGVWARPRRVILYETRKGQGGEEYLIYLKFRDISIFVFSTAEVRRLGPRSDLRRSRELSFFPDLFGSLDSNYPADVLYMLVVTEWLPQPPTNTCLV